MMMMMEDRQTNRQQASILTIQMLLLGADDFLSGRLTYRLGQPLSG